MEKNTDGAKKFFGSRVIESNYMKLISFDTYPEIWQVMEDYKNQELTEKEDKLKQAIKIMARLALLVDKKVTDDLGIRIDLGTVFNKSQVMNEVEQFFEPIINDANGK